MSHLLPDNKWTDQRVVLLRSCSRGALSFSQIAKVINETTGSSFTRNACIGKAKRIHLNHGKPTVVSARRKSKKPSEPHMRKIKAPPRPRLDDGTLPADVRSLRQLEAQAAPDSFRGLTLIQLEAWHCRYPRGGDGAPVLFCGQPKMIDSSYCPSCHARCCGGRTFRTPPWLKHWGPRS